MPALARAVPLYALYGEESAVEDREFVHLEALASRSSLYDWEIKPHLHAALFQVLVVSDGRVGVTVESDRRAVSGPAAIVVPAGIVHGFQMSPDTRGMVVSVAVDLLQPAHHSPDARILADVLAAAAVLDFSGSPDRFAAVEGAVAALHDEVRWPQPGRSAMVDALLRRVLVLLWRQLAVPGDGDRRAGQHRLVFQRFRALVEEHYRERWLVPDYAAALGTSESKLNRICRALAGRSAFELLQDRVLLEAQRYLVYTAAPVSQVAYDLGFSDPGYFCRYFRRRTGEAPGAFRAARAG
ncbi:helix-turn-helix domain-containing protein [Azospirillum sp. ST 5-10]|uniref:helix-turn-helix domain-containing protein n=1 Tax=unclassified Azospirillum TaxID=2630922 RepID=UPI003F4A48C9